MKALKRAIRNLKVWAAKELFKVYFTRFFFPFLDADATYQELNATEKARYLSDVYNWVNSKAFEVETQSLIRGLYRDMAIKPFDDVGVTAYRLTLMVMQDNEKRLRRLAKDYELTESLQ